MLVRLVDGFDRERLVCGHGQRSGSEARWQRRWHCSGQKKDSANGFTPGMLENHKGSTVDMV